MDSNRVSETTIIDNTFTTRRRYNPNKKRKRNANRRNSNSN